MYKFYRDHMPPYNLGKLQSPRSRGFLVIDFVISGKGRGMHGVHTDSWLVKGVGGGDFIEVTCTPYNL